MEVPWVCVCGVPWVCVGAAGEGHRVRDVGIPNTSRCVHLIRLFSGKFSFATIGSMKKDSITILVSSHIDLTSRAFIMEKIAPHT